MVESAEESIGYNAEPATSVGRLNERLENIGDIVDEIMMFFEKHYDLTDEESGKLRQIADRLDKAAARAWNGIERRVLLDMGGVGKTEYRGITDMLDTLIGPYRYGGKYHETAGR